MAANLVQNRQHRNGQPAAFAVEFTVPKFVGTPLFPFELAVLPNGWLVAVAEVGPELATAMLELNADYQRNETRTNIEKFARDMLNGEWLLTHQGIAFNRSGLLFDGQNRLLAIVKSATTQPLLVFFGAGDREEMAKLDTGGSRKAHDAAKVMGLDVERNDIAMIRAAVMGAAKAADLTHSEIIHLAAVHGEAISWVSANLKGPSRSKPSGLRAGLFRAYYHCDLGRLARFAGVYQLDVPATDPGDRAAILLNKFITGGDARDLTPTRAAASQYEMRNKTMRAIEAFMGRVELQKLQLGTHHADLYPLPADGKRLAQDGLLAD